MSTTSAPMKWKNLSNAKPHGTSFQPSTTALIMIDMQRDFLDADGFGAALGNPVANLSSAIEPCKAVLRAARDAGMLVIHTREGHRPDLTDLHLHKNSTRRLDGEIDTSVGCIGTQGKLGRILVRGEPGHDIIPDLYPKKGEPIIDKPGK